MTEGARTPRVARALSPVVLLLVLSVAINYVDRGNLAVAAPLLKKELGITEAQKGLLLSSFFWSYAFCQMPAGWIVDRFGAGWVLAIGFFIWTGATAITGVITGFAALLVVRLVLGVGESVAYPCYSKVLARDLEEADRGLANVLIDAGSKCGPALGTLIGGYLVGRFGWRPFFIGLGVLALLWLPGWLRWMPRRTGRVADVAGEEVPFLRIFSHRSIWAACWGHFSGNYYWYFLLTWLPSYLVEARHQSLARMGVVASVVLACSALSTLTIGWISFRALRRGASTTRVRKTCTAAGLGLAALFIVFVPFAPTVTSAMGLLVLAGVGYGSFATSHWAIAQTIAGPVAVGRWSGIQNFAGNLAGVVAPAVTGYVVQATGSYTFAFVATSVVALTGALGYLFGLGPVEQADWSLIGKTCRPAGEDPKRPAALPGSPPRK